MDNWKDAVDIYSKEENCDQSRLGGKTRSSVWNMLSLKCVLLTWRCRRIQECGIHF